MKEIDKWAEVHDNALIIHEFLEYLCSKGIALCDPTEDGFFPIMCSYEELVYDMYNIDKDQLEKERRQLLKEIQNE